MKIKGTLKTVLPTPAKVMIEDVAGNLWRLEFLDPRYFESGSSSRTYRTLLALKKYVGRIVVADITNHPAFGWTIFGRTKIRVENVVNTMHASVHRPGGTVRQVRNLGWFFRKARTTIITDFKLTWDGNGWQMTVSFADGDVFSTPYADLNVFRNVMSRQRSLHGVVVRVNDGAHSYDLRLPVKKAR